MYNWPDFNYSGHETLYIHRLLKGNNYLVTKENKVYSTGTLSQKVYQVNSDVQWFSVSTSFPHKNIEKMTDTCINQPLYNVKYCNENVYQQYLIYLYHA